MNIANLALKFKTSLFDKKNRFYVILASFFFLFYILFPALITFDIGKPATFIDWFQMPIKGGDFVATYVASRSLTDGYDMYHNNASHGDQYKDQFAGGEYSRYSYPPLQAYILAPLSYLSFEKSYQIWTVLSIILTLVSIFLISRLTRHKNLVFTFLVLFYGLSSFFWFQIERGQTDTILLFFTSSSFYLYFKKRNIAGSALFFSLAILLKVFPALFVLFFLIRKEFKLLFYTLLFSLGIIFVTGYNNWIFWFFSILPQYSNYYLGAEVDHSLAYLLSGFWDQKFPIIISTAKVISVIIAALYVLISYIGKNKKQNLLLVELAILSIIAEISTPWSANYKLVTLILLFITPFLIMEIKEIKNKILLAIPLLVAFLFFSPIYNEYYGRLPFSFIASLFPGNFIFYQPLSKLAEFRVSASLLFCLVYLFGIHIFLVIRNKAFFNNVASFIKLNKKKLTLIIIAFFLIGSGALTYTKFNKYRQLKAACLKKINSYGRESKISDNISLVGYDIRKKVSGSYDVELIIGVNKEIKHHFAFYIHGYSLDPNPTVEGINFFPYFLVSYWSAGKYVVINKTVNLTAKPQIIKFGLFDISDGSRHGKEVELGVINLNEVK